MSQQISLLYHDVVHGELASSGFTSPDADSYKLDHLAFADHLAEIAQVAHGRVVLAEGDRSVVATTGLPVLFTFDDGGVSAYTTIAPMLESRGWRGHFFIVTSRIGAPGFLTAEQILELHRRGHHIGAHSHTHPFGLSRLPWEQLLHECRESRRLLTDLLGEDIWSFSVPGGYYSTTVAQAAKAAGYRVVFNSEPSATPKVLDGLMIYGRFSVKRDTPASAVRGLAAGSLLPRLRQSVWWNAKKPLKVIGGRAWLAFRTWFFASR